MTGQMAQTKRFQTQDNGRENLASVAFCTGRHFDRWNVR